MIKAISQVAYHVKPVRTYPTILTCKILPVPQQASVHESLRENRSIVHVH